MDEESSTKRCPMCGGELELIDTSGYVACAECPYWEYGGLDEAPRLAADVPASQSDPDSGDYFQNR